MNICPALAGLSDPQRRADVQRVDQPPLGRKIVGARDVLQFLLHRRDLVQRRVDRRVRNRLLGQSRRQVYALSRQVVDQPAGLVDPRVQCLLDRIGASHRARFDQAVQPRAVLGVERLCALDLRAQECMALVQVRLCLAVAGQHARRVADQRTDPLPDRQVHVVGAVRRRAARAIGAAAAATLVVQGAAVGRGSRGPTCRRCSGRAGS